MQHILSESQRIISTAQREKKQSYGSPTPQMKKNNTKVFVFSIWSGSVRSIIAHAAAEMNSAISPFFPVSIFVVSHVQVKTENNGPLINA